jgi:hypothetical protein
MSFNIVHQNGNLTMPHTHQSDKTDISIELDNMQPNKTGKLILSAAALQPLRGQPF